MTLHDYLIILGYFINFMLPTIKFTCETKRSNYFHGPQTFQIKFFTYLLIQIQQFSTVQYTRFNNLSPPEEFRSLQSIPQYKIILISATPVKD